MRLVETPWAPAEPGLPPLPAPGPVAKVEHAPAGAPPRFIRRHWAESVMAPTRRRRKAYARINRLTRAKGG